MKPLPSGRANKAFQQAQVKRLNCNAFQQAQVKRLNCNAEILCSL
jgi:hypothetical protein